MDFVNAESLKEVRELLPPNHCIKQLDENIVPGQQKTGDYFMTVLDFFSGKKKRKTTCIARLILSEVLEDDSIDDRKVECFVYGTICKTLEKTLKTELGPRGSWSTDRTREDNRMIWAVLHRPFITHYRGLWENWNKLSFVVGPETAQGEMLLFGIPPRAATPSTPSPPPSPLSSPLPSLPSSLPPSQSPLPPSSSSPPSPISPSLPPSSPPSSPPSPLPPSPPPPSTTTTTTTITSDAQPSISSFSQKYTLFTQDSLAYSKLTSSIQPAPPNLRSQTQSTSTTSPSPTKPNPPASAQPSSAQSLNLAQSIPSEEPSAPVEPSTPAQPSTSAQSLSPIKQSVQGKSPSKVRHPSKIRPSFPTKTPTQPKLSITSRSATKLCSANPSRGSKKIRIQYKTKHLSLAEIDCKMSTAGVVVEVVKAGHISKNNTVFDIIKVADKRLTYSTSTQTHMMVKVFHNDKVDWPEDGKPERGQVMVLKDMMCKMHNGMKEGIVYTTKMVCICKCDEDDNLTWYSQSQKCPHNIENADQVALELFDWWKKDGCVFQFKEHGAELSSRSAAVLPTCNISQAGGKGLFTLNCQVVKKTLYPALANPKSVLRVCDGSRSSYQFEEIVYNPINEVRDDQRVFGEVGSLEVDILVSCNTISSELKNLQVGSFVQLRGVDCRLLPGGYRKLFLTVNNDDDYLKVLEVDDPELMTLEDIVGQARIEENYEEEELGINDDSCSVDSEMDGGTGLVVRESSASPHINPSSMSGIPNDSFEVFIKNKRRTMTPPNSPISKKQRLDFSTSESLCHTSPFRQSFQSSTTKQAAHPSPQPHASKHVKSPQPSTSRKTIHPSSPQPSTSRQPLHPSPNNPSISKQPLHPSSPKPTTTTESQQHSSRSPVNDQISISADTVMSDASQTHLPRQLQFHTELLGEAKQTNLETFFLEGKVGEMHHVEAAITDIKVITTKECPQCTGTDHLCFHQWVWGLCQKCDSAFSSSQLLDYLSSLALNSLDLLPCKNCTHQHKIHSKEEDREQPLVEGSKHHQTSTVSPFINMKVVVEDPASGLQLTPWLTANDASCFFGVKPIFSWIMKGNEKQKVVESLLALNHPLALGMMKKEVEGRVDLYIVKTALCNTISNSKTAPDKPPHPQLLTSQPHPELPHARLPHHQPPPITPPQTQPPATSPQPLSPPASPPKHQSSHASTPEPQSPSPGPP